MIRTRIPSHLRAAPPLYRLALYDSYWQLLENKKLHEEEMTAHAMAKAKADLDARRPTNNLLPTHQPISATCQGARTRRNNARVG